jgi:hypothetical protein
MWIIENPFGVAISRTHQLNSYASWNTGGQYTMTSTGSWSSNNTSVATVSGGLVSGVSAGSATEGFTYYNAPVGVGYICHSNNTGCPTSTFGPTSPGTVQKPASLSVLSVNVLPTGTSGDYGCTPTSNYGIRLDIKYQTLDQNGQPLKDATMVPHEHVVVTETGQTTDGDICPSSVSTCTHTTDANGQWHDAPYGACGATSFSFHFTQDITIVMNGVIYPVRTNVVATSSSSAGHGSISNGSDISKTR